MQMFKAIVNSAQLWLEEGGTRGLALSKRDLGEANYEMNKNWKKKVHFIIGKLFHQLICLLF